MSSSTNPEPRTMKWESNGELAQHDLTSLINRLLDVESQTHSDELSRLGNKCEEEA